MKRNNNNNNNNNKGNYMLGLPLTPARPVDYWVAGIPALNYIGEKGMLFRWCVVHRVDIKNNRLFIKYAGHRFGFWVDPVELVAIEDIKDLILM